MRFHLSVSIAGLEDRVLGKIPKRYGTWEILQHDDGTFLTKSEVMTEIVHAKDKGYKVFPICENVDVEGRCQGHEK